MCSLRLANGRIAVTRHPLTARGLSGRPDLATLAAAIGALADHVDARLLFVDGPQGWKSPENGLEHCRVCERELATQGKTGLPGYTKPSNYLAFIRFAIDCFDELAELGWPRLADPSSLISSNRHALESFPTSAWRSLGLRPLPGKRKTTPVSFAATQAALTKLFELDLPERLTHDELQAVVAGLAGIAIERCQPEGYALSGVAPFLLDGSWREGFIVNPTAKAAAWCS